MLEVASIDVYYGHIQALRSVSLNVQAGEVVALLGGNGAGKSTTLRAISALNPPLRGEILLDGNRIDKLAPETIVSRGVAHLPEGRGIFPSLTVEENLRMGHYTRRRDSASWKNGLEQITDMFPILAERIHQAAGTLSGGEQQMLALSRSLLLEPRLLMIDELSLGLAPRIVQQLFRALEEINARGTTVLLVEQHLSLALRLADRVYVLEKGKIALEGRPDDLLAKDDRLRSLYLGGGFRAQTDLRREAVPAGAATVGGEST